MACRRRCCRWRAPTRVFARDGELIPLTMVQRDGRPAGRARDSPETARAMREMLRMAAGARRHGAAGADASATRSAARPAPRTSRKARATRRTSTARGSSAWRRSSNPRVIVAVMVDEPSAGKYYGGDVAAPVFSARRRSRRCARSACRPTSTSSRRSSPTPRRRGGELLMLPAAPLKSPEALPAGCARGSPARCAPTAAR